MWFVHDLDPILVQIGPLAIRWYGLAYLAAFLIIVYAMQWYAKNGYVTLTKDDCWDYGYYCLLGVLIGARLFEVFVWSPSYYLSQPWKIIAIWEGGLAFHGGLIGFIVGGWYFARKKNIPFLKLADLTVIPISIGLGIGRLANFINGEIWGPPTDVAWCVQYGEFCRHPYQLYAAAKHWVLAAVLYLLQQKKQKEGMLFFHFMWLYGIMRFFLDFYRDDSSYLWLLGLSTGQWSCLVMIVIGVAGLVKLRD